MAEDAYVLETIGVVRSSLRDRSEAPRQGGEGAPDPTRGSSWSHRSRTRFTGSRSVIGSSS